MEGNSTRVFTIWAPKLYLVSRNLCADEEGSIAHHSRIDSWIFSSCCCSLDELVFWLLLATMQSFPSQFSKYMSQIERYRSLFASQRWYLCRSSTLFEGQRNQHNRRNGALLFFLLLSWSLPGVRNQLLFLAMHFFMTRINVAFVLIWLSILKEAGRVDLIAARNCFTCSHGDESETRSLEARATLEDLRILYRFICNTSFAVSCTLDSCHLDYASAGSAMSSDDAVDRHTRSVIGRQCSDDGTEITVDQEKGFLFTSLLSRRSNK